MKYQKKLTARARVILVIAPLFLMLLIAGIGYSLLGNQLQNSSRQLSRQHAIQTSLDFQHYLTPHIELLRQSARSWTISQWIADIDNQAQKQWALNNIEIFHRYNPDTYLMFTTAQTRTNYLFQTYVPAADMDASALRSTLSENGLNGWFEEAMNTHGLIHKSIQLGNSLDSTRFWLHHRTYFNSSPVGVVSVGFRLDSFMETMFSALPDHVQVYLVDAEGNVHINSSNLGVTDTSELIQSMSDVAHSPQILEAVNAYFELLNAEPSQTGLSTVRPGLFPFNLEIGETLEHHTDEFDFANVAPLAGTAWVMVMMSSYQSALADLPLFPLLVSVGVIVFLVSLLGGVLLRQQIIEPLEQLALSLTDLSAIRDKDQARQTQIYGTDRQDEIGYVAQNIELFIQTLMAADEELKQLQVVEESNRAKSQFLARMSHEIRTPISAILGISEVQIKTATLTPATKEALHRIYASGNLLLGIINDILDLSRIEHGSMEIITDKYQVASLISDVLQRYTEIATAKSLSLDVSVSEHIPAYLVGDALRIQQVLNNVLSNAFKYTLTGGVTIVFELVDNHVSDSICELELPNNQDGIQVHTTQLQVSITDTGIGMTQKQVDTIFDEYTRFAESAYRTIDGTGLGMSIVSNLLGLMGASIDISSTVNVGTTVRLVFPQQVSNPSPMGHSTAQSLNQFKETAFRAANFPKFSITPLPYARVLVVDDLDVNLYVAEEMLRMYQLHTIDTAISGQKAIDLITSGRSYDIVFMDHMMPGLDGIETLQRLREMGYTKPIVALTANAMIGQESKFREYGFDDFLSKPIQSKRLDQVLKRYGQLAHPPERQVVPTVGGALPALAASHAVNAQPVVDSLTGLPVGIINSMQDRIRVDFQKNYANVVEQLQQTLAADDMKQAHLLVHSLKGVAGLLRANALAHISSEVETVVRDNRKPTATQLKLLQAQVSETLANIDVLQQDAPKPIPAKQLSRDCPEFNELLDKLTPLMQESSTTVLSLLPELSQYTGTSDLIEALNQFEFTAAVTALELLRQS